MIMTMMYDWCTRDFVKLNSSGKKKLRSKCNIILISTIRLIALLILLASETSRILSAENYTPKLLACTYQNDVLSVLLSKEIDC